MGNVGMRGDKFFSCNGIKALPVSSVIPVAMQTGIQPCRVLCYHHCLRQAITVLHEAAIGPAVQAYLADIICRNRCGCFR